MLTNFWSFVYIIVKGSWAKVGCDISTSHEMTGTQSWSIDFFLFFCSDIKENCWPSIFKTFISKLVKISPPTLLQKPSTSVNEQKLVGITKLLLWFLTISKSPFVICSLYGVYRNMTKGVVVYVWFTLGNNILSINRYCGRIVFVNIVIHTCSRSNAACIKLVSSLKMNFKTRQFVVGHLALLLCFDMQCWDKYHWS